MLVYFANVTRMLRSTCELKVFNFYQENMTDKGLNKR